MDCSETPRTRYVLLVGDGMADYPIEALGGRTPLEAAHTPNMDRIAQGRMGLVQTIPEGMEAGSDVANLCLLGYDPRVYHSGRSPLEAASLGVSLAPDDVAFRMNLVSLDWRSTGEIVMLSHSSGDITTAESREMIPDLQAGLESPGIRIYPGVAYRHLLVWSSGPLDAQTIPPHDVLGRDMASYLDLGGANPVPGVIRSSWPILREHPVNRRRRADGRLEANSVWLWGQGRAPQLPRFTERFGLTGGVISAVDLLRGIGIYAGFDPIFVEGATGYLDTNYRGKGEAAIKGLETRDFVLVHVEAPDEASHNGSLEEKIQAIEAFDAKVVGTVLDGLSDYPSFRVMVASDHFTPICLKTHSREPAPFAWAGPEDLAASPGKGGFTEKNAAASGIVYEAGHTLMPDFLGRA